MEDSNNKTPPYNLPHFRVEKFKTEHDYQRPDKDFSGITSGRDYLAHGPRLRAELAEAFQATHALPSLYDPQISTSKPAVYLEVTVPKDAPIPDLSWKSQDIRFSALRVSDNGEQVGALYIPHNAEVFLTEKVREYATETTDSGKPKLENKLSPVENFSAGSIKTLWTDSRPFPQPTEALWWECWCLASRVENFVRLAQRLQLRVSEARLSFPDIEVVPVYANAGEIQKLIQNSDAVEELRKASDNPCFFTRTARHEQAAWVEGLIERIRPPASTSPAICILDHGVNQQHPLLSLALAIEDCQSVHPEWGGHDHDGHGTNMAGSALYGDITYSLADQRSISLATRLESVKFLPPPGWERNDPANYGVITQSAVSIAETRNNERQRVYCMAVSNTDVSGERPTSWSSAIDQICSGSMVGDEDEDSTETPKRLFILSAGNIPDSSDPDEVSDIDEFPIEDPAQAWNAIAVGGFTDKIDLSAQPGLEEWQALAEVGDHSPYSRTSADWDHSRCPIKPEIVFEAGNRAISPDGRELLSGVAALSILTTGKDFTKVPLEEFWATSAATAQAAGMAAAIMANHPDFWPETVRALMIHSAQWTPAMLARLKSKGKKESILLARHFGYGVPQLNRALSSAQNDLALISEAHIQPFIRKENHEGKLASSPSFNEVHYYDLPWPKSELERLENKKVSLKITLSYFIEPSPGEMAQVVPARYQSFGLRFELKRKSDTETVFRHRVNKLERHGPKPPDAEIDNRWTFGPKSIAAGSVHSDVWTGPAIDLASRDKIAIYPVAGWWRYRSHLKKYNSVARYSLVVSISSQEEDVNLYSEIAQVIATRIESEIST
ncbi:S8 family peptidase [Stutzerimonas stutzeri]|uniref:S8 family peptidase n=1 Tax=Stutzerimonas stutzeri TaxID=316 RepID=UPI002108B8D9|nr:S8 family peptidase [Stutzerimonas stutzeri]MCQ4241491.1 S8 family peptidase [Stutzerimonas stutzeri]